ncbi:MAG: F420-0:Gamma-glutamyl ligase [Candidatus Sericytochromatia bacterium]
MKRTLWGALLGAGSAMALFELWYRSREDKPCQMLPAHRHPWRVHNYAPARRIYRTNVPIRNFSSQFEATVVDLVPSVRVLGKKTLPNPEDLKITAQVRPWHKETREDGYWPAYILSPQSTLEFELSVTFEGDLERLKDLHAVVIHLDYSTYSRRAKNQHHEEIVLIPEPQVGTQPEPVTEGDITLIPIKTHILTDADHMSEVVAKYVSPIAQEGDIVVMAESVVAITQRRYLIPDEHVKPGFWASRLCFLVPNMGSLSSRYGMQSAINEVGLPRMLTGMTVGAAMKALGRPGWLYRIAGMPSELIDDLTGTMPPYDKYIVLGPAHAQSVVNEIKARTGLEAAISDVNNLRRAAILAATKGVDIKALQAALLSNPHGNSAEQTPLVVVRSAPVQVESESRA